MAVDGEIPIGSGSADGGTPPVPSGSGDAQAQMPPDSSELGQELFRNVGLDPDQGSRIAEVVSGLPEKQQGDFGVFFYRLARALGERATGLLVISTDEATDAVRHPSQDRGFPPQENFLYKGWVDLSKRNPTSEDLRDALLQTIISETVGPDGDPRLQDMDSKVLASQNNQLKAIYKDKPWITRLPVSARVELARRIIKLLEPTEEDEEEGVTTKRYRAYLEARFIEGESLSGLSSSMRDTNYGVTTIRPGNSKLRTVFGDQLDSILASVIEDLPRLEAEAAKAENRTPDDPVE